VECFAQAIQKQSTITEQGAMADFVFWCRILLKGRLKETTRQLFTILQKGAGRDAEMSDEQAMEMSPVSITYQRRHITNPQSCLLQ